MSEKNKTPAPSLKGLWSLLWRATVLFPFAAIVLTVYLAAWVMVFTLPVFEIYFVWRFDWLFALIAPGVWVLSFLLVRWKRCKIDPRDILNERENI